MADGDTRVRDLRTAAGIRISGRVVDEAGPVAGAEVSLDGEFVPERLRPRSGFPAVTDELGRFELGGLISGQHRLIARAPGHAPGEVWILAPPTRGRALVLRLRRRGAGTESPPFRAGGVVRTGEGRPAAGAVVRSVSGRVGVSAVTVSTVAAADGTFALEGPGAWSSCRIEATLGGACGSADASRDADQVSIALSPLPSVRGTVVTSEGAPASGARVLVGQAHFRRNRGVAVDWLAVPGVDVGADGRYEVFLPRAARCDSGFGEALLQEFVVAAVLPGHTEAVSEPFSSPDGAAPREADFVLGPDCDLHGRLLRAADRTPIAGAPVCVSPAWKTRTRETYDWFRPPTPWPPQCTPDAYVRTATTDADGRFAVTHLGTGTHRIEAWIPECRDEPWFLQLPWEGTAVLLDGDD